MPTARYLDQPYLLAGRRIDPITGTLSYREVQKHLRRKELEVLALLAEAGGEQVPRSVFIEQVWQGNPIVGEQGLTDTISALRRSLLDTDRENPLILTIPRRGYQLRASIRLISRDGGVAFVAGTVIDGRPDWRLKQLLEQTDAHESWLAEDGRSRRIFRFCRNEQQLRKLRREVVLMRYLREALASQEHVSTILDWQLEEPPYFLELAAPACGNLRGVMLGKSVPELAERWCLMQEVAEALAAVHAAGVVHRALSPDSVLVDRRSGERVALLGEFGLAALDDRQRLAELGIDAEGLSLRTGLLGPATAYTAPECVAGAPASAASDVYALGVLIAQTLRGDFQRLESSGFEDFPDDIAELLTRCLATDPTVRPTAAELAAGLKTLTQPKPAPRMAEPPIAVPAAPVPVDAPPVAAPAAVAVAPTLPEAAAPPLTPVPLVPQRIGRYRIVNELAQGGMGVVYLAEQSEPVQRRVALKLIRAGLDSAQVLARFEAERQALAMMNHPNISAIFDAGTTPGGYPYFVMEYVPGTDIKTYCDEAKLNLRARIRLFLQVCDGVLHAHQKGLIHRDLKPGNVLVTPKADQSALVKLIDFGVAKSLTGGLGSGLQTVIGSFVGTPVYSCPEQVIHPTRDIDTRADLYSLGVVLYELLTGVPPRSQKELDADTPAELARRLRDTKTPAMGSRFAGLSVEDRQRIADFREMSEQGLSMQLGSDLDWIVSKCIAQDPEDRYATVQDLRLDLQRWLDDRPVEARPTSTWYRFRKVIRRNRLNTAITAISVLTLVGTSSAAVIGYLHAERARLDAQMAMNFQGAMLKSIDPAQFGAQLRQSLIQLAREERANMTSSEADRIADIETFKRILAGLNLTDAGLDALLIFVSDVARKNHAQCATKL
ncbi:MAG: protein kinase [Xanthomonadales bacterium]|jgi:serine/threonine protein kinase/DNA-binding winged helix-turn-helix (wHTH) protein|nr:protein kinase [Xanthomonadales bacterium]